MCRGNRKKNGPEARGLSVSVTWTAMDGLQEKTWDQSIELMARALARAHIKGEKHDSEHQSE